MLDLGKSQCPSRARSRQIGPALASGLGEAPCIRDQRRPGHTRIGVPHPVEYMDEYRDMSRLQEFETALMLSPLPALLVDKGGRILLSNAQAGRLFGYAHGELTGELIECLIPEGSRHAHAELRNQYFEAPTARGMGDGRDLRGLTKQGEAIPVELALEPVDVSGEPCALVFAIDIRKRLEQEHWMRLLLDASASAMVLVDDTRRIVASNRAAVELLGVPQAELHQRPVDQLFEQLPAAPDPDADSGQNSQPTRLTLETQAQRGDGGCIPVQISAAPVENQDQTLCVLTIVDLSERRASAEELQRKSDELAQVNFELTQFAYSASHDLKAPLSSISGLLDFCLEDLYDKQLDEVERNLKKCLEISRRSANKVENVLAIASAGSEEIPRELVHLGDVIAEIWLDTTGANEQGHRLELVINHRDPVSIELPTFKVVLENLLSNAVRFVDADKAEHVITVETRDDGDTVALSVADNGIGIPADKQEKVFDMFRKLSPNSGDGLGLSLVKKQVERLGGQIALRSQPGEGACFTVTLPITKEPQP